MKANWPTPYSLYKVVRGISRDSCQSAILYPVLAVNTQCQVCNVKSSHKFQGGGNPDSQNIGARSLWLLTGCLNVSRLFLTRILSPLWLVRGHHSPLLLAGLSPPPPYMGVTRPWRRRWSPSWTSGGGPPSISVPSTLDDDKWQIHTFPSTQTLNSWVFKLLYSNSKLNFPSIQGLGR